MTFYYSYSYLGYGYLSLKRKFLLGIVVTLIFKQISPVVPVLILRILDITAKLISWQMSQECEIISTTISALFGIPSPWQQL